MDALRDHRRSDLRHDLVGHRVRCNVKTDGSRGHRLHVVDRHRMDFLCVGDLKLDGNLVVNRGRRMNDRLGDRNLDDDRHDVLVGHRTNVTGDRNDLMMVVNLYRHTNDLLDDHLMDVDRHDALVGHRMNGMDDRNLDVSLDVSRGHRKNDQLDDQNLDVKMDGNLYRHTNVMDDRNDLTMVVSLDVSRGHRMSGLLVDQNLVAKMDGMNLHVRYY